MKRITVAIVEDDRIFLDDLLTRYNWQANGFDVIVTASNGLQALHKFQRGWPDLIITDIRMPVMDGLELIREVRALSKNTHILLLSSYGEFIYAKKAIEYGVYDYLLKNELDDTLLSNALSKIRKELANTDGIPFLNLQHELHQFFQQPSLELALYSEKFQKLIAMSQLVVFLEEDLPLPILEFKKEPKVSTYQLIDFFKTRTNYSYPIQAIGLAESNRYILTFAAFPLKSHSDNDNKPDNSSGVDFTAFCRKLQSDLQVGFGSFFSIFYRDKPGNLLEIRNEYFEHREGMSDKYFLGKSIMFPLSNFLDPSDDIPHSLDFKKLDQSIKQLDSKAVIALLEEYLSSAIRSRRLTELIANIRRLTIHLDDYWEQINPAIHYQEYSWLNTNRTFYSIDEIRNWILASYGRLFELMSTYELKSYSQTINNAIQYLKLNFSDRSLSISDIASHVSLSEGRLGVLFKKEVGKTINDYLTSIRISFACRLLQNPELKIYEIAEKVGYASSQYFSQIFFQKTGHTPNEFRKSGSK